MKYTGVNSRRRRGEGRGGWGVGGLLSLLWTNALLDKCLAKDSSRNMRIVFFDRKEGGTWEATRKHQVTFVALAQFCVVTRIFHLKIGFGNLPGMFFFLQIN